MNYTIEDSMSMNNMDRKPWRGAREDTRLLRLIIEGTIVEGDVVLDCTTCTRRHIVALEADKKIFAGILQHMKKLVLPVAAAVDTEAPLVEDSQDLDAMTVKVLMIDSNECREEETKTYLESEEVI